MGGEFLCVSVSHEPKRRLSLQLLLPQPVYPSPNAIYPSAAPWKLQPGAVLFLRQKYSLKNVHGLTEPKGISLPPTPTVLLLSLESVFFNPVPHGSLNRHLPRARRGWELARSDAPFNSIGS